MFCYTSNPDAFEEVRKESKEKGLKVRIINGEMYVEKQKNKSASSPGKRAVL